MRSSALRSARRFCGSLLVLAALGSVRAQWNPAAGEWGKVLPDDLRVMTWNIHDNLATNANKVAGQNAWEALARIVAGLRPDVLLLQEAADNGTGVDSVANMLTVLDLFLHGGTDPFQGNLPVTAFVQLFAPGYDLPYVFVSSSTDGFNRDVILSRYPFADLNGDGRAVLADFTILHDTAPGFDYAPGGTGGIRGFQHAEIDLPDATYSADLVVGNSHLKAGSSPSDHNQRIVAAQNIAYYVDAEHNGLGTFTIDPDAATVNPSAPFLTAGKTTVVLGGDWNEDELTNGTKGPAEWITRAALTGGTDGTDRDRTDMNFDAAVDFFTGNRATLGGSKFDYMGWQDSRATLQNSFIFNSTTVPAGLHPPELLGFPNPSLASNLASDHRPVIVDLAPTEIGGDFVDLGASGIGSSTLGEPLLAGSGDLTPGSAVGFDLSCTNSQPFALGFFFLSDQTNAFFPFFGGTFYPLPLLYQDVFGFDGTGSWAVHLAWDESILPGTQLTLQFFFQDASGPFGVTGSNGLRLDVP